MFEHRIEGKTLVVSILAQLTMMNRVELKNLVLGLIENPMVEAVAFDLAECGYVDSTGMGILITLDKNSVSLGKGKIRMANVNEDLRTILQLNKLDTILEIVPAGEPIVAPPAAAV